MHYLARRSSAACISPVPTDPHSSANRSARWQPTGRSGWVGDAAAGSSRISIRLP